MASFLLYSLLIVTIHNVVCESLTCPKATDCGPCQSSGESCTLDCVGQDYCKGSSVTLTCESGVPCMLTCDGIYACTDARLIPNGATSVTITCTDSLACSGNTRFNCEPDRPCYVSCLADNCNSLTVNTNGASEFSCTNCPPTVSAPYIAPTSYPTLAPTNDPTPTPTLPTIHPTPTKNPTPSPTDNPTPSPTDNPTPSPTSNPTPTPIDNPTPSPTDTPSFNPSLDPSINPTASPTTINPTTDYPSSAPTTSSPSPTDKTITARVATLEWELFINDEYDNTEDMLNLINVTIMDYLDELRVDYDYQLNVDAISNKDGVFTINVIISSDGINSVDKEALNKQIEDAVMMKHSTTTTMGIVKLSKTNNHEMLDNIDDTVLYVIIGCAILLLILLLLIIVSIFILRRQQQYLNDKRNGIEKSLNTTSDSKQAVIRKVTDENDIGKGDEKCIEKEHDICELNEGSDTEQMYDNKYLEVVAQTVTGGAPKHQQIEVIDNTSTGGDPYVATETMINIEK